MREARQKLSSTSSEIFHYPSFLNIPDQLQQDSPSIDLRPEKEEKEQDLSFLIPTVQVDNFSDLHKSLLIWKKLKPRY